MRLTSALIHPTNAVVLTLLLLGCGGGGGSGGRTAETSPEEEEGRSALLAWSAPTTNSDGSCLDAISAYRISYGLSSGFYLRTEVLESPERTCIASGPDTECGPVRTCSYLVDDLVPASWYFAIQAVDASGRVSDYSNEAIKTIP